MSIKQIFKGALLLGAVFSSTMAFAQDQMPKRTPEQRAQRQTIWMQKNIGLTPEQSKKVYHIILTAAQEQERAMQDPASKQEKRAIKRDTDGELQQVLSPDQYKQYVAHREQMKEKMKANRNAAMQETY